MLLHGEFHPGERIAEIPLSLKLGVSRTPLRLAFEKMEREGLVKALRNSGFAASELSVGDIWDAIETRGVLEGAAARLAAEHLKNPAQLEPLRKINDAMNEMSKTSPESYHHYLELNEAFHKGFLDLSGSQILRREAEQIYRFPFASPSGLVPLRNMPFVLKEIVPVAQEHHRVLLDAMEHREGARAESIAREHARMTRRHVEFALQDRNVLEAIPGGCLIKFRAPNGHGA